MELFVPADLRLTQLVQFTREISALPHEGEVYLDFREMNFAGPFAMLLISTAINRVRHRSPNLVIHPRNYSRLTYFCHMGFFRACGIDYGKEPGAASGNQNYLPITREAVSTLRDESRQTGRPIGELVEDEARSLAGILSRSTNGAIFDVLVFALREIIRNTVEHSRAPAVEYCAQYWPNQNKVEIAVVDRGIGIHKSLEKNPTLKITDERHAINLALLPGISCNVRLDGTTPVINSVWQNSGFGLFMTQRMCRHGGDFFLGSGNSGRLLTNHRSKWMDFGFAGTAVRLVLNPSSIGSLSKALTVFEADAKRIARENNIRIPDASTASRRVRLDFRDLQS